MQRFLGAHIVALAWPLLFTELNFMCDLYRPSLGPLLPGVAFK